MASPACAQDPPVSSSQPSLPGTSQDIACDFCRHAILTAALQVPFRSDEPPSRRLITAAAPADRLLLEGSSTLLAGPVDISGLHLLWRARSARTHPALLPGLQTAEKCPARCLAQTGASVRKPKGKAAPGPQPQTCPSVSLGTST
ncbi:hypothetical protein HPB50_021367 [Hyalomma asiaticum]|uniref:Uncharacterized protein n=1 Tax=Hyalomma asiaticum TaxID=266040 RepID=A0ACB7T0V8_HYAAI|nr:hypothetical protein HPB50_021367 [Hyalomma asiaticum]